MCVLQHSEGPCIVGEAYLLYRLVFVCVVVSKCIQVHSVAPSGGLKSRSCVDWVVVSVCVLSDAEEAVIGMG